MFLINIMSPPRLSRFQRSPHPPTLQLTDRDLDILEAVGEYRFITREQLQRLFFTPASASAAKRRLSLLYNHAFVERTHVPVRNAYGALRTVYSLDRGGAQLLARERRWEPAGDWRRRDGEREATFLDHTLDCNDVRVAFTLACRRHGHDLQWTDERELRRRNVVERIRGRDGDTVTLIPDAYFTIASGNAVDGFALEVDRGTVSERRMRARLAAYGSWAASGAYRQRLPAASFRVAFAVTDNGRGEDRLGRLKQLCEEVGGGSLFWFIGRDGLDACVLDDPVWQVAGEAGLRGLPLGPG